MGRSYQRCPALVLGSSLLLLRGHTQLLHSWGQSSPYGLKIDIKSEFKKKHFAADLNSTGTVLFVDIKNYLATPSAPRL
jgi:hypothetical protein